MTVNIRLLLTFMVACLPFFTAFADNVDEIKAQINKVKKSSYLRGVYRSNGGRRTKLCRE